MKTIDEKTILELHKINMELVETLRKRKIIIEFATIIAVVSIPFIGAYVYY